MQNESAKISNRARKFGRIQAIMPSVNERTLKCSFPPVKQREGGEVYAEYEKNLNENFSQLLARMKKFIYYPQPTYRDHSTYNMKKTQKHELRSLKDEIVKIVFKEVLKAIYGSRIFEKKSIQLVRAP